MTRTEVDIAMRQITQEAGLVFQEKLKDVILYGSYARGDQDEESDIDIMILASIPQEDCSSYRKSLEPIASAVGLDYDVLVSICVQSVAVFDKWVHTLPFYQSVKREGVSYRVQ